MDIEKLVSMRTKVLFSAAIAFGIWQFAWIAQDLFPDQQSLSFQIAGWTTVVGALLWVVASFYYYHYSASVKKMRACKVLNDELTVRNRAKAFTFGYFCMLGATWLLIGLSDLVAVDLKICIRFITALGVILPILYFVYLEQQSANELEQ